MRPDHVHRTAMDLEHITNEAMRERLAAMSEERPPPWERFAEDGPSLRPIVQELTSQARQVGRFGSEEQRAKAITVLETAKADLYALMAEPSAE